MSGQTSSVYVCNLPLGTNETLLAEHFGQIGLIKKDKRTGRPKIWLYRDKSTNEPKGDATVTYEDPHAAAAAVEWFHNKEFRGNLVQVSIAESKSKDTAEQPYGEGHSNSAPVDSVTASDYGLETDFGATGILHSAQVGDAGPASDTGTGANGRGRGRGGDAKWQQEGDWQCPNPSCENINFSFRGVCNRCNASRPAGAGGGSAGGGRGRGRGAAVDSAGRGAGRGVAPWGGPNDWHCPMCGNHNWAKRTKCNICNTTKPGHNEGGVREGRGGGYKELDEAELEETKRRRRELEEDDGEMYDEFGNLKKKFRIRAKQGESTGGQGQSGSGFGSAGWDKEELGVIEKDSRKNRGSSRDRQHREDRNGYWKEDERGDADHDRSSRREREYERERRDRDVRTKDRERDRDRDRDRGDRERERDRDRDREKRSR